MIKLDEGKIFTGFTRSQLWSIFFVAQMLTHDLFAVADFFRVSGQNAIGQNATNNGMFFYILLKLF